MATTMKGLLKGLRYISQIFEAEEEEPEMQIGHPTDVKHLAHIGLDGPSSNSPSWMNGFQPEHKSEPLLPQQVNKKDIPKPSRHSSMDITSPRSIDYNDNSKQSRRRHSAGSSHNVAGDESPDGTKTSRRHHHSNSGGDDGGSVSKHSRKKKSSKGTSSSGEGSRRGSSKSRMKGINLPPNSDQGSGS